MPLLREELGLLVLLPQLLLHLGRLLATITCKTLPRFFLFLTNLGLESLDLLLLGLQVARRELGLSVELRNLVLKVGLRLQQLRVCGDKGAVLLFAEEPVLVVLNTLALDKFAEVFEFILLNDAYLCAQLLLLVACFSDLLLQTGLFSL